VLSNPLCFLSQRYGKSAANVLKSTVLDFYSASDLVAAKQQLMRDVSDVKTLIQIPHVPVRRDDEHQATRVVDDIFTVLTCLDENLLLKNLPKYVADSPDNMPSTRLYEGDLGVIMNKLEKLGAQVAEHGPILSAIVKEIRDMQVQVQARSTATAPTYSDQVRHQPSQSGQPNQSQFRSQPSSVTSGNSSRPADTANQSAVGQPGRSAQIPSINWSAMTSSPIPTQRNRYAVLETTDDERNTDSAGGEQFTEYQSRRSKRRRSKTNSDSQEQGRRDQPRDQPRQQAKRLLVGKGSTDVRALTAAKKITIPRKAVFCIDNINKTFSADDLRGFVSKMNVKVISCFEVKPRRRRDEIEPIRDRKAFRLCRL